MVHDPSLGPVGSVSHVAVLHANPDKQHVRPIDVPSLAVQAKLDVLEAFFGSRHDHVF